jgi:hypothetical protein
MRMTPRHLASLAVQAAGVRPQAANFKVLVEKVTETINAERAAMAVEISATKAQWYDSADAVAALDQFFSALTRSWAISTSQKRD